MRASVLGRSDRLSETDLVSGHRSGRPVAWLARITAASMAAAITVAVGASGAEASFHGLYVSPTGSSGQADTSCATAAYSSIQSAVNAVGGGHRVFVCPGTYNEQVTISTSNVELQGYGATSIIDPTTSTPTTVADPDTGQATVPIIDVTPGTTGVRITNLVVNGAGLTASFSDCSEDFVGIWYRGASGGIGYSTVKNVDLGSSLASCGDGLAVFAQAGSSGTANLTMNYDTLSNYDKNGVTCVDAGATCSLHHLKLTGAGPSSSVGAQNGIQIGPAASGSVTYTTVSGQDWTGGTNSTEPQADYAAGILLYAAGGTTTVSNDTLVDDQVGVQIVDSNAALGSNLIKETGSGITGSIGVFDVPCDFYCSAFSLTPGANTLSLDFTKIAFAGRPSGSYGVWLGGRWTGPDCCGPDAGWGSSGTVTYTVTGDLVITGAAKPFVHGPRAVAS
jgi:hypothetical protein